MKNTTSTRRKSMFLKKIGMLAVFSPIFLSLFSACADTEPIDEDETDPSINPPITFVEDDEETPTEADGIKYKLPLSFPGGEGYGRDAMGARAEKNIEIYHVTNTNNSGEGSFRDAVSKSGRIIVFDTDGVVNLTNETLVLQKNITILGQTAPGDGIVLYGGRVSASGADNIIVRYLRIRMGTDNFREDNKTAQDAIGIANGQNMIFDHCSVSWGTDENFSINSDGKGTSPQNITIQNCIIGQGLMNHSAGGLIQTNNKEGVTLFRNLYIDNGTRNPKVKGLNQFVNNVLYNWGKGAAYNMGGESEGESEATIEDNYFIVGPCYTWTNEGDGNGGYQQTLYQNNPTKPFIGGNSLFRAYLKGNYYDNNKDGILNGHELLWTECSGTPTLLNSPSFRHKKIWSQTNAKEALSFIIKYVGASLPTRDQVDQFMIDELTSYGLKGTIIRRPKEHEQFPIDFTFPGEYKSGVPALDTDGDGIPDDWEDANGLDKNDPSDAVIIPEGEIYTWIEIYANSLVPKEGIYIENK